MSHCHLLSNHQNTSCLSTDDSLASPQLIVILPGIYPLIPLSLPSLWTKGGTCFNDALFSWALSLIFCKMHSPKLLEWDIPTVVWPSSHNFVTFNFCPKFIKFWAKFLAVAPPHNAFEWHCYLYKKLFFTISRTNVKRLAQESLIH